ncbi:hypothetical protein Back11_36190 [Paenibacillus baekrokdamisoli]|uniref:Uncharacterized protein n=1 Tax=Paenibacillus baekrokdamisoli TaxID=1712516 RepID=A0A3G9JGP6_9BACL|nr:GTPase domain-containing protein [Paenibacillus baekrokdamisoli]MBB3070784.1 GTPase Era involved in 16S rRNA processing [Paenibacillus baekrokdamisoli]BBH22274.1 hypothetical protein Back11_36190 [Paenibacillus baekrokdamisoli]
MILRKKKSASSLSVQPPARTVLEHNLIRLRAELSLYRDQRKVAVLGQPGAGKSTLLDLITLGRCSPRPVIGQQTDATNWSTSLNIPLLHHYEHTVFVDAPGYDTLAHPVEAFLKVFPFSEFDRLLLVLKGKIYESDDRLWQWLKSHSFSKKLLVARSFAEGLSDLELAEVRTEYAERFDGQAVMFSNRDKRGIEEIKAFVGIA